MLGNDAAEGYMKVPVCNPLDALQTYRYYTLLKPWSSGV